MASRASRAAAVAGVAVAFVAGAAQASAAPLRPTPVRSFTARLVVPTAARAHPGAGAVRYRFGPVARYNGGPIGLLVLDEAAAADGSAWLRVALPRRPNGSSGWIPRDRTRVRANPWRIAVSRARRTLTLFHRGRFAGRWRVVVGASATPTPTGLFAVDERVRQPSASGFVGAWVFHLTAFSDVLDNFGGGPGRIGLHGRGGASLRDPLGTARSHGCVRMDNRVIAYLARRVHEGTPVRIR